MDWIEARHHLDGLIMDYSRIGPAGQYMLSILYALRRRYEQGERTDELYNDIMECE